MILGIIKPGKISEKIFLKQKKSQASHFYKYSLAQDLTGNQTWHFGEIKTTSPWEPVLLHT